ncbi:MAG TPA: primase-helicase family protein [Parapedobacter sp.]|uniref:primase-helicase family protein n=1 Tax=Parapedobacter sp. TaxID=1958893 RepID=UPI002CFE269B|nr:primase-helicase family protein [Parapedobacter sp.]HWK58135.1 primase-helicase family protein [Parapedobacter sp.]
MQYIDADELLQATNGGLDIIKELYPDAAESEHKKNRKFKIRQEKTASASLFKKTDTGKGYDVWLVTDFGSDSQPRNGILCYAHENGLSYVDAIQHLAQQYGLTGQEPQDAPRPDYSERPATSEEQEGHKFYELRDSFTDQEIETLFAPNVLRYVGWFSGEEKRKKAYTKIKTVTARYNLYPAVSHSLVKNRKVMTFASNERYPIFIFTEDGFAKIYQPKNKDHRFSYIGERTKDYMHGLKAAQSEYKKREAAAVEEDSEYNDDDPETQRQKRKVEKLPEIILASGGSDALNLALLDYWPVWLNSETADFTDNHWFALLKIADKVYQLQDIDATGRAEAHKKAMTYLDLYTIELPQVLATYRDRGKPCKDVRDYFRYWKAKAFRTLVETALPYRFWDRKPQYTGRGSERMLTGYTYEFNNVQAYNFLAKNGFYRLATEARKVGYMFIKIEGNIVRETEGNEVKNFVHEFLKERMLDNDLRNAMYRTTQLSESSLSNLPFIDIEFNDTDKHEQYYIFQNTTLQITSEDIIQHKPGAVNRYVWQQDVIEHFYKPTTPAFTITYSEEHDTYDITVNHYEDLFFNYLIQTSRIHWRKELEQEIMKLKPEEREDYRVENKFNIAGPLLTDDEQNEQKKHLINKLFAMGYLLHRFKDPRRPWCVFAMDNHINDDGGSHGRSGKSILFHKALPFVLRRYFYLGGRNPKITDNPHIYDGLTEHHRYIYIDDADEYINFKFFFDAITGELKVNPKNMAPYTIPYEKVGKYAITSNFTLRNIDPSTEARLLYTVFSDFYHIAGETTDYLESRSPGDDFGKNLFMDFTDAEWNHFYVNMMQSLRFYLSVANKIDPPMNNVSRRNLLADMGPDFEEWAAGYFSLIGDKVDRPVPRDEARDDFNFRYRGGWKTQRFSRALRAFCKYNNYILNPKELINTSGATPRIMMRVTVRKLDKSTGHWHDTPEKVSKDMIYIQTKFDVPPSLQIEEPEQTSNDGMPKAKKSDDLPF